MAAAGDSGFDPSVPAMPEFEKRWTPGCMGGEGGVLSAMEDAGGNDRRSLEVGSPIDKPFL